MEINLEHHRLAQEQPFPIRSFLFFIWHTQHKQMNIWVVGGGGGNHTANAFGRTSKREERNEGRWWGGFIQKFNGCAHSKIKNYYYFYHYWHPAPPSGFRWSIVHWLNPSGRWPNWNWQCTRGRCLWKTQTQDHRAVVHTHTHTHTHTKFFKLIFSCSPFRLSFIRVQRGEEREGETGFIFYHTPVASLCVPKDLSSVTIHHPIILIFF